MTMQAFVTGSRAYGKPSDRSDIDLVVFCEDEAIETLYAVVNGVAGEESDGGPENGSFMAGRVNLICTSCPITFAVWKEGTETLKRRAEIEERHITRKEAISHFRSLRKKHGIHNKHDN